MNIKDNLCDRSARSLKRSLTTLLATAVALSFTTSAQALPKTPNGKKWQKVDALSDEFKGNSLNTAKWKNFHPYWKGRNPSHFKTGNVAVFGDYLRLKSTSRVRNTSQVNNINSDIWVDAACVTSQARGMKIGMYSEARIKSSRLSMTSSFWFQGRYSEIDVIENIGAPSNPKWARLSRLMEMNSHYFINGWNNDIKTPQHHNMGVDHADDFHVFGVHWRDNRNLDMYLDGKLVKSFRTGGAFNEDMLLFLDTETFTWGVGLPKIYNLDNNNRNTALVDWVHTYRLVNGSSNNGGGDTPPNDGNTGGSSTGLPKIGQTISLKGSNTNFRYLTSENGSRAMSFNRSSAQGWEMFSIVDAGGGSVALKGNNGKYVSHENGNAPMNCNRNAIGAWEKFTLVNAGGGTIALKGSNGRYVSHENGAGATCNRTAIGGWEKFTYQAK